MPDTQDGVYTVTFVASDNGMPQESDIEEVVIAVGNVNIPPVLNPIGDMQGDLDDLIAFGLSATDADGDALVFSFQNAPFGSSLTDNNDGTALFEWMPTVNADLGNHPVTFSVVDNNTIPGPLGIDSEEIVITIGNVNRPPTLAPIANVSVNTGDRVLFNLSATDPDGDAIALTYTSSDLPKKAKLFDNGDGTAVFDWDTGNRNAGLYEVTFHATDAGTPPLTDSIMIVMAVGVSNRPPSMDPIGPITGFADADEPIEFLITGSDPDGDNLTYTVNHPPANSDLQDNGDGTAWFRWTPVDTDIGEHNVTL